MQAVVRQALYHLGELTDSAEPELSWRAGWDAPGGVLDTLCAELEALVADLEPVSGWLRGGGGCARDERLKTTLHKPACRCRASTRLSCCSAR